MNIINTTQLQILESKGFPISRLTSHLRIFRQGNDAIDATALKKLCPFIITTGQTGHGFYATTRQSKPEWIDKHKAKVPAIDNSAHYVYGDSECDAICKYW